MAVQALQNRGYAHADALVTTEWVAQHLNDPHVRVIESNEDPLLYSSGVPSFRRKALVWEEYRDREGE